jgi:hypothetical protein
LVAELYASANAHDADRTLAVYARDPGLIFIINGEIIRGWDASIATSSASGEMAGRPIYRLTELLAHRAQSPCEIFSRQDYAPFVRR